MNNSSWWLGHWLQKSKSFTWSYLKDGNQLLPLFQSPAILPPEALLFTAGTNSLYTNMHMGHVILVITEWLKRLRHCLPHGFPHDDIIEAITLIMTNNIFEWGDIYFLQLLETAMCTSTACMGTTIYFAVHENQAWSYHLKAIYSCIKYKHVLNNIFGIWIPATAHNTQQYFAT